MELKPPRGFQAVSSQVVDSRGFISKQVVGGWRLIVGKRSIVGL
jgi:hypothetical protein